MRVTFLLSLTILMAFVGLQPGAGFAQSDRFRPAIIVNGDIVTQYEMDQRQRFLELLRIPGDSQAEAERGLIDDRLRRQAAKAAGVVLSDQQLTTGMAEFAARANLETEQFLLAIGQGGIAPETYRDFVAAGMIWREVVRARFGPRISISEAEIDRALSVTSDRGAGPRVLLSEIILPTTPGTAIEVRDFAEELTAKIGSEAAFAAAARQYSASPSRDQGGQIGWIPLTNLPPQARQAVAGLANGQVSPPVPLGNAIGLFRLRGLRQSDSIASGDISIDYLQLLIPNTSGSLAEVEKIRGQVDTCDDLFFVARNRPPENLIRETSTESQIPRDVAAELAKLDENELSGSLTRGDMRVIVMLCQRTATLAAGTAPLALAAAAADNDDETPEINPDLGFGRGPSRAQIRDELTNQKLARLAEGYLAELKANAMITRP